MPGKFPSARRNLGLFPPNLVGDTVPDSTVTCNQLLIEFRAYLETLTYIQIDPRLRSKFSVSEIIQNTLAEAWRELERIETMDADRRKARLREMLIHNPG
jgi:hypothetical protein